MAAGDEDLNDDSSSSSSSSEEEEEVVSKKRKRVPLTIEQRVDKLKTPHRVKERMRQLKKMIQTNNDKIKKLEESNKSYKKEQNMVSAKWDDSSNQNGSTDNGAKVDKNKISDDSDKKKDGKVSPVEKAGKVRTAEKEGKVRTAEKEGKNEKEAEKEQTGSKDKQKRIKKKQRKQ
jgi:hypothetical protein